MRKRERIEHLELAVEYLRSQLTESPQTDNTPTDVIQPDSTAPAEPTLELDLEDVGACMAATMGRFPPAEPTQRERIDALLNQCNWEIWGLMQEKALRAALDAQARPNFDSKPSKYLTADDAYYAGAAAQRQAAVDAVERALGGAKDE